MNYPTPESTESTFETPTLGVRTYYTVFATLSIVGIGLSGILGVSAGLLVGGIAGTVLMLALTLVVYAVSPSLAAAIARRIVLGPRSASTDARTAC